MKTTGTYISKATHRLVRGRSAQLAKRALSTMSTKGIVEARIEQTLSQEFSPHHLQVINESHMHSVPRGSESHFKVVIVSDKFEGVALIQRHRLVNDALAYEFKEGLHALSIQSKTLSQWESSGGKITPSPACGGGIKKELRAAQNAQ